MIARILISGLILSWIVLCDAKGQRVGIYDTLYVINQSPFNGIARQFSLNVPGDYSASISYPLVVGLHGFTQIGSTDFRDRIAFLTDSIDAIVICPDGDGNQHDDEFSGLEVRIVTESIDLARNIYNIDSTSIYLMGFSWGGREAIHYGLAHHELFRGLIPFAPAYQSVSDANNGFPYPWANPFNYSNGKDIPTCICVGEDDGNFYNHVVAGYNNFVSAGSEVYLNEIPSVGHTTHFGSFDEEIMECFNWINNGLTGIDQNEWGESFKVYPNPVKGTANLKVSTGNPMDFNVYLHDSRGRVVYARALGKVAGAHTYELPLDGLATGVYHVVVRGDDGMSVRKLVVLE